MSWPTEEGIAEALREIREKGDRRIEGDTAETWGYRAIASYREYARTGVRKWLSRAKGYADETIEHAGLSRDGGRTLRRVERAIDAAERSARARVAHRVGA